MAHLLIVAALVFRRRTLTLPRRSELYWMGFTLLVFLGLALTGSRTWARTPVITVEKEIIEVYGRQFAWSFRYPGPDRQFGRTAPQFINDVGGNPMGVDPGDERGSDDVIAATLRIPAGRDVILLLHSRDVIHDFFVRELRTKQDIVPGMEIPLEIRADIPGQYEIACAELCGLGHSQMRSFLAVMPPEEYVRWRQAARPGH